MNETFEDARLGARLNIDVEIIAKQSFFFSWQKVSPSNSRTRPIKGDQAFYCYTIMSGRTLVLRDQRYGLYYSLTDSLYVAIRGDLLEVN